MSEEEKVEEETEKEQKERETEIVEERIYTVPLSRTWISPVTRRAPRAVRLLKVFVKRHMKVDDDSIIISNDVNEKIWDRGIEKPPRRIRVRVTKDIDGFVTVHLAEGE
ncbi:MAG: 50S ribosomal protein L31e [Candidatus Bathyarchaeota archaeon]|nr:50S ribosomal protein L31e [Candidatus Bathyarchaeota archaeon]